MRARFFLSRFHVLARLALSAAAGGVLAAGCAAPDPAPSLRLQNVTALSDSLLRPEIAPRVNVAVVSVTNPGPAIRLEEFAFALSLGDAEYAQGRFRADMLFNPGETRLFHVTLSHFPLSAVQIAKNRARPVVLSRTVVTFVGANGLRRTEHWPANR